MKSPKVYLIDLLSFFLLILLVILVQSLLLKSQLNYGFMPDDWWPLYDYRIAEGNFLERFKSIYQGNGFYTTYQVYYIGVLHDFFGFNFRNYQITNQVLKFLATLSIFFPVFLLTKSKLTAGLATLIYAMSYASVGTLEITAKGLDFLGIVLLSTFLSVYIIFIKNKLQNIKWLSILMFLLILTIAFSPIRMYPLLILIFLTETYFFLSKENFSIKRIAFLFGPFFLGFIITPYSFTRYLFINMPAITERVIWGNWHLLLHPFSSFGSIIISNENWNLLGTNIELGNLNDYLNYLLYSPYVIFSIILLFLSIIYSKSRIKFFLIVFLINLSLGITSYLLIIHRELVNPAIRMHFDIGNIQPMLAGFFILSLGIGLFWEWKRSGQRDLLLLSSWLGILFSFIFVWFTWILADYNSVFKGVHSYLNVPSIGVSLFTASFITLAIKKTLTIKRLRFFRSFLVVNINTCLFYCK